MLAKICEGIPDALRQLRGEFLAEFKYDGMRCQVHLLADGRVKLFSRNCTLLPRFTPVGPCHVFLIPRQDQTSSLNSILQT